ncbi:MAG: chromosomal replication initiator protein DnaA [Clostridia bacterium]|nr:chromosomal replication initiator protein DnaA [Clostridia bacterium]
MINKEKLLSKFFESIKNFMTETSFDTFIKPLRIYDIDEQVNIIYCYIEGDKTGFITNIVKERWIEQIENSFKNVANINYRIVIKNEDECKNKAVEKPIQKSPKKNSEIAKIFNPKYTFDNFVVGECNKFAQAASVAVADAPGETYNPLLLYGGSGLGKTHLMNAIGIYILDNKPDLNVMYITTEGFGNEFIKALSSSTMSSFQKKYRNLDVLLIDDIQFLEGKDSFQEEFFNTFNTLIDQGKQIIISSDRPPAKLTGLDERLRTRLAWNLVADIQPADYETRIAILLKKAELEEIEVNDEIYNVICNIAEKIPNNIRELEGAFSRVCGFAAMMNEAITVDFAKRILKDIMIVGDKSITPEKIKKIVCKEYNIKIADIDSSKRTANIAIPRQIAMYLCRNLTDLSFENIGKIFGDKHYSTVIHSYEKINSEIINNKNTAEEINKLKEKILN